MISPECRQQINEYLRRKNGTLRVMVAGVGVVAAVTAFIAWDIKDDVKKKDTAREEAVAALKKTAQVSDELGRARYDSLAAQIRELKEWLGIIGGRIPPPAALDTLKLEKELYEQKKKNGE